MSELVGKSESLISPAYAAVDYAVEWAFEILNLVKISTKPNAS